MLLTRASKRTRGSPRELRHLRAWGNGYLCNTKTKPEIWLISCSESSSSRTTPSSPFTVLAFLRQRIFKFSSRTRIAHVYRVPCFLDAAATLLFSFPGPGCADQMPTSWTRVSFAWASTIAWSLDRTSLHGGLDCSSLCGGSGYCWSQHLAPASRTEHRPRYGPPRDSYCLLRPCRLPRPWAAMLRVAEPPRAAVRGGRQGKGKYESD